MLLLLISISDSTWGATRRLRRLCPFACSGITLSLWILQCWHVNGRYFRQSLLKKVDEWKEINNIWNINDLVFELETRENHQYHVVAFLPTAIRWSVGTFARPIGSAFAFSQVNPSRDCHLQTHQILRGYTRIFTRAYFLRLNNVSHMAVGRTTCHAGTKSARPSIARLSEPQWGLPLTEPPRPYYLNYYRSRSNGRKLSTPSTSRTPAARRGEPSTNLLAGLDAPPACAPSRQIPLPRSWWRTGHTRLATARPSDSPARSCPTYGRFQHLNVTVSLNHSGRNSLLLSSDAWSQENLRDWTPSFPEFILHTLRSWFCDFLNSCMHQLKIPKIWIGALVVAIPKPEKPLGDPKSYCPISLLCVPFKILERLMYARVEPIIDPLLPQEQAGFRHRRSAVDQVTLLT